MTAHIRASMIEAAQDPKDFRLTYDEQDDEQETPDEIELREARERDLFR